MKWRTNKNISLSYRLKCCIIVVSMLPFSLFAQLEPPSQSLEERIKGYFQKKEYQKVIDYFAGQKQKKSYKDHIYNILAFKKMSLKHKHLEALEEAHQEFPEKKVFTIELAKALEAKANFFPEAKKFTKIKEGLHERALGLLTDLKNQKASAVSHSALIQYLIRNKKFTSALSQLEIYSRSNPQGEIYFTMLCQASYGAQLLSEAEKICSMGATRWSKNEEIQKDYLAVLEALGKQDRLQKRSLSMAGRFPASADAHLISAKALLNEKREEEAVTQLEEHVKLKASDEGLVLLANHYYKKGKMKEALKTFVQACRQHAEPRGPLIINIKNKAQKLALDHPLKDIFMKLDRRCKYDYKPKKEKTYSFKSH